MVWPLGRSKRRRESCFTKRSTEFWLSTYVTRNVEPRHIALHDDVGVQIDDPAAMEYNGLTNMEYNGYINHHSP